MIRFKLLVGVPTERAHEALLRCGFGNTDCFCDGAERVPAQAQSDDLLLTLGRVGLGLWSEAVAAVPIPFRLSVQGRGGFLFHVLICSRDGYFSFFRDDFGLQFLKPEYDARIRMDSAS
jgi:hypothetical protein